MRCAECKAYVPYFCGDPNQMEALPTVVLHFHPDETVFPQEQNGTSCVALEGEYRFLQTSDSLDTGQKSDLYELQFSYDENPAIGCGWRCCPTASCLGYHKGDIESIFFLVDDEEVQWVYFKAHARGQGVWVAINDCEIDLQGLHVYVARGSHAFYPEPKTYWRIFGLANDTCSVRGHELTICAGNLEPIGPTRYIPAQHSITKWERIMLMFNNKRLKEAP